MDQPETIHRAGSSSVAGGSAIFIVVVLAILLIFTFAWLTARQIESRIREETGFALTTVLDGAEAAVGRWKTEQSSDAVVWSELDGVKNAVRKLVLLDRNARTLSTSDAQQTLRHIFSGILKYEKYFGYFVISLDGINLASSRDINIGTESLLGEDIIGRVVSGEIVITPPQASDVALPDMSGNLVEGLPTMFVGVPVHDDQGFVTAVLAFRLDVQRNFEDIFHAGRVGRTGETYAFDVLGLILSGGRFGDQIRDAGLLKPDQPMAFNVQVRDPGGDITQGFRSQVPISERPLTRMASAAIAGRGGIDLAGYRDYRGVPVVGVWVWDSALKLGIATEIDVSEAYGLLNTTRRYIIFSVVLSAILLFGLATIFIRHRRKVEENAKSLQTIVDSAADGIITIDEDGLVENFNRAAEIIFGYLASEVIGRNVNMLMAFPHRAQHNRYIQNYLTTGKKKIMNRLAVVDGQRKDGSIVPIELTIAEARLGGDRRFIGTIRDITERQRVDNMKSEFVSAVSHELRTPLTSIKGSLGLVIGGAVGELPEKANRMVTLAQENTDRLINLVNDILDIEKLQAGKVEFKFKPFDMHDLVNRAVEANRGYAKEYDVQFLIVASGEDAPVNADFDRLLQVMANLLSNAAKFSHRGGTVEISIRTTENMVRISVRDDGDGIPEGFRDQIFERFTQADSSDTRRTGGTGLGLNISKAIVQAHKGTISFESTEGEGATFYFDLPLLNSALPMTGSEQMIMRPEYSDEFEGDAPPRILVCHEDRSVANHLSDILRRQEVNVDIAENSVDARKKLKNHGYAVLIISLSLGGEDGLSLIGNLRSQDKLKNIRTIVVSGKRVIGEAGDDTSLIKISASLIADCLNENIDKDRIINAVYRTACHQTGDKLPRVLHVEDDPGISMVVSTLLEGTADVTAVVSVAEARRKIAENKFDLAILDVQLPDGSGIELLEDLKNAVGGSVPAVIFSARDVPNDIAREVETVLVKSLTTNEHLFEAINDLLSTTVRHVQ